MYRETNLPVAGEIVGITEILTGLHQVIYITVELRVILVKVSREELIGNLALRNHQLKGIFKEINKREVNGRQFFNIRFTATVFFVIARYIYKFIICSFSSLIGQIMVT